MWDKALLFFYQLASSHLFFPLPAAVSLHAFLTFLPPLFPCPACFPGASSSPWPLQAWLGSDPHLLLLLPTCPIHQCSTSPSLCGYCFLRLQGAIKWLKIFLYVQFNWLFGQTYLGETLVALVQIFWELILSSLNLILSALVFLTDSYLKHHVVAWRV